MRVNNITIVGNMCIRLARRVASIDMNISTARIMIDSMRRVISNRGRTHKRIVSGRRNIDMIIRLYARVRPRAQLYSNSHYYCLHSSQY